MIKRIMKQIKHWYWLRRIKQAADTLRRVDGVFRKLNVSRQQRRQFWLSMTKDPNEAIKILLSIK
jgi:hypothetical protein